LTGSGETVGYVLIIKLLPSFFAGPLAGVVADRFNRKTIMIVADIVRAFLVLGFLFVQRPDQVWMVYVLAGLEIVVSSFFEPAKSAAIPSIVSREELVPANALSSASWSITLALGAALGGLVTDAFGRNTAFVIDSLSFFISAAYIIRVHLRFAAERQRSRNRLSIAEITGLSDFIEGARYLKSNPGVIAFIVGKERLGSGGGVLLLLTVYGKQIFPIGEMEQLQSVGCMPRAALGRSLDR
jgi:MFS family permease